MRNHEIEQDAEGNLSYRGWRLLIVPCGSQYELPLDSLHRCRQPTYLAFPPYEGTREDWSKLWIRGGHSARAHTAKAEYAGVFGCRHVAGDSPMYFPTIMAYIDEFECLLEQARKETWEEVRGRYG